MLGTCPVTLDWVWVDGQQLQSQELMGCVHFILAGEPGRDFLGQWPRPGPHSFSDLSLTLWCMSFLQLPFSQEEGAEAEWQGWEAKGVPWARFFPSPRGDTQ